MLLIGNALTQFVFWFLFQSGAGGGMSSSVTPMSRPGMGSIGGMGGGYAGANDMTNNGLSANQNQVRINYINIRFFTITYC